VKSLIFAALLSVSTLTQGQVLTELNCESWSDRVELNLDYGFGRGLRSADAELYIDGALAERMFLNLFSTSAQYRYRYWGSFGSEFELDTWPDLKPQWGRMYRGTFTSRDHGRYNLNCRFR